MFDVNKTDAISSEGLATKIIVDEEERSWSIVRSLSCHIHFAVFFELRAR